MSQVGWLDPTTGKEASFDDWLALAATEGEAALGYPYEVLLGISEQAQGRHRPEGITVTQLNGCLRSVLLSEQYDYYATPASNYAAFRGTVGHAMLEKFQHPDAVVEQRVWRKYGDVVLSGQVDKVQMLGHPAEDMASYLEWCRLSHAFEMGDGEDPGPRPFPDAEFLVEDWKTKHDLPTYQYVARRYATQGNLYRWLLRIPKGSVHINFVFVSMEGVRSMPLYEGGTYRNGRKKPDQIWSDSEVKAFLDKRLKLLDASRRLNRPIAYANVPTDDLWECNWCPAKPLCYRLAAEEARLEWEAGRKVERIPPRDRDAETGKDEVK